MSGAEQKYLMDKKYVDLCVGVVHLEVGYDDGDGQGDGEDAAQGTQRPHEHAQVGLGHHVPVAHRGHRHQRPPQPWRPTESTEVD